MAQVVYDGPQPARVVVLPTGKQIRAEKGKPVDVPAKVADALVRQRHWDRSKQQESKPFEGSKEKE